MRDADQKSGTAENRQAPQGAARVPRGAGAVSRDTNEPARTQGVQASKGTQEGAEARQPSKADKRQIQAFPLYETLLARVRANPAQSADLRRVCTTINNMSQTIGPDALIHLEAIQALIIHHEMTEGQGVTFRTTPYGGKTLEGGRGVLYSTTSLPPLLHHIIAAYVMMIADNS